ncbi:MAG: sigma 54-interacting transcriptional regulator [Gammaproteobacteria bacterium]
MQRAEIAERLRDSGLLEGLSPTSRDALIEGSRICKFAPGDVLMREGDPATDAFLLLEGRVSIRVRLEEGHTHEIALRDGVTFVGESALLGDEARSASVIAYGEVHALAVPPDAFRGLLLREPAAALELLRSLIRRVRESDVQLVSELRARVRALRSQTKELSRDLQSLRSALGERKAIDDFIGASAAARAIREDARHASRSDVPVLIQGETGTGKELLARAIHAASARAERPFFALNCALMSEPLLESELFGHARGAFTGAVAAKRGLVEACESGTLFLDEVADMSAGLQAALLRFLELGEFRRLGETRVRHAHPRIMAATQTPLEDAVRRGTFRRDLLYRLDVVTITIPPLRERLEDLPALASHVAESVARRLGAAPLRLQTDALEALGRYDFPGNVRELENEIERLYAVVGSGATVGVAHLKPRIGAAASAGAYSLSVRRYKSALVDRALRESGGNRTRAAEILGMHRSNFLRTLRDLEAEAD